VLKKKDARKLKPEVLQERRNQAIRLRKKRMKIKEIADIVEAHFTTVSTWCSAYKKGGA